MPIPGGVLGKATGTSTDPALNAATRMARAAEPATLRTGRAVAAAALSAPLLRSCFHGGVYVALYPMPDEARITGHLRTIGRRARQTRSLESF
ncbi:MULTISPECIES: hypothetical protein [Geobacter]|nr:hypothetical protein [Geobacter sulfurreducens]UAC03381.1 hypothetical protein KVP06_13500 [Geobacter sulfurreducens]BET57212.1 hypothetical protein GEO60473_02520 [Geobacter sp. 60473]